MENAQHSFTLSTWKYSGHSCLVYSYVVSLTEHHCLDILEGSIKMRNINFLGDTQGEEEKKGPEQEIAHGVFCRRALSAAAVFDAGILLKCTEISLRFIL